MVKGLRVGKESEIEELESDLLPWGEGWGGALLRRQGNLPTGVFKQALLLSPDSLKGVTAELRP